MARRIMFAAKAAALPALTGAPFVQAIKHDRWGGNA